MTTTAIVPHRRQMSCPDCTPLRRLQAVAFDQPAMFWLHGYGWTWRVIVLWCRHCGYSRHSLSIAVAP